MNIDFIKWMVQYAEGFNWYEDPEGELVTFGTGFTLDPKDTILFSGEILYPLLLQRAIEGINRYTLNLEDYKQLTYIIFQNQAEIKVRAIPVETTMEDHDFVYQDGIVSIDQAKEQALRYIYEQENK